MTTTELAVVIGGLVLGYWIVSVLLPTIGGRQDDVPPEEPLPTDTAADPQAPPESPDTEETPSVRKEM